MGTGLHEFLESLPKGTAFGLVEILVYVLNVPPSQKGAISRVF